MVRAVYVSLAIFIGFLVIDFYELCFPSETTEHLKILETEMSYSCNCLDEDGKPYMRPNNYSFVYLKVNFEGQGIWIVAADDVRFAYADSAEVQVFRGRLTKTPAYFYAVQPIIGPISGHSL